MSTLDFLAWGFVVAAGFVAGKALWAGLALILAVWYVERIQGERND